MTNVGYELSLSQAALFAGGESDQVAVNRIRIVVHEDATSDQIMQVLEGVTAHLEVLRTAFVRRTGAVLPHQIVHDTSSVASAPAPGTSMSAEEGPLVGAYLSAPGVLELWAASTVADHESLVRLGRYVGARLAGTAPSVDLLDEDALQFVDFSGWEAEQREDDGPERRLAAQFWLAAASAAAPSFDVPSDVPVVHRATRRVPGHNDADAQGWLAAWLIVLRRNAIASADSLAVRMGVSGRPADAADAIGPYRREVVVALALDPAATVDATRATLRDTLAQADRFAPYAPESTCSVGWSSYPSEAVEPAAHAGTAVELLVSGDAQATVVATASTAVAADALAARLAAHVHEALEQLALDGSRLIAEIEVLTADEIADLAQLGTGAALSDGPTTLRQAFAAMVSAGPDRIAVDDGRHRLTFAELDERADRVARALSASCRPGAPVAIAVDRSVDSVVAMIAVHKLGLPFQPINPTAPADYVLRQLTAAGTPVVLCPAGVTRPQGAVTCVDIDALARQSGGELGRLEDDPDAPAYLLSTSGSTGEPKIVIVSHRNITAYSVAVAQRLDLAPGMRLAIMTMLSTDLAYTALMPALVCGCTVRLFDDAAVSDVDVLQRAVVAESVDLIKMTPSHLRALCASVDARLEVPTLVLGGEALDAQTCQLARRVGAARVVNHYGPTETTVGALAHLVPEDESDTVIPVGRALPGVGFRIVDERLRPVPGGCRGELVIGGAGVATGYLGQPELTADRFVDVDGLGRAYRTGDAVRLNGAGDVVFLGRLDTQVKIRGFRVELGEIEARLRECAGAGVVDAAVIVDPTDLEADRLLAFVTARVAVEPEQVLAALATAVPAYMVPARLTQLETLPRTASGKIDRLALPSTDEARPSSARTQPLTPTEIALLDIWSEALGMEDLDPVDDFFRVGGHSLLATRIMARSRSHFGVELPLHLIFSYSTVRAMAGEIDERLAPAAASAGELADLLARIENMSEAEAQQYLAEQSDEGRYGA